MDQSIGQIFKSERERRGHSQIEFSKMCGISNGYYSNIESGNKTPTTYTINKVLKALKAKSVEQLILVALTNKLAKEAQDENLDRNVKLQEGR